MSEEQEARITALRARVDVMSRAAEERDTKHEREMDEMYEAALGWKEHARRLELAMEAIETLHDCHDHLRAGLAMDVVRHIARAAGQLTQPKPVPDRGIPF